MFRKPKRSECPCLLLISSVGVRISKFSDLLSNYSMSFLLAVESEVPSFLGMMILRLMPLLFPKVDLPQIKGSDWNKILIVPEHEALLFLFSSLYHWGRKWL